MKVVSLNELHMRLVRAGICPDIAYKMLIIQDWFLFQKGLQDELHFPEEELRLFDNTIGAPGTYSDEAIYDPTELESYFIFKLRVSEQEAKLFSTIEFQYLEELGIV